MQNSVNQIQVLYELNVLPDKADELKEIASKMVSMNATEEPGTLVYNVYLNDDETLFTYLETYNDTETGPLSCQKDLPKVSTSVKFLKGPMAVDFVSMAPCQMNLSNGPSTMVLSLSISL